MPSRKLRLTVTQQRILHALQESGELELCALMNTVHPHQESATKDEVFGTFSRALWGLWTQGFVLGIGIDLPSDVPQDWNVAGFARDWLGTFVTWDEERAGWAMLRHFTESPHVVITRLGLEVLQR
jgi:hypothetical protein